MCIHHGTQQPKVWYVNTHNNLGYGTSETCDNATIKYYSRNLSTWAWYIFDSPP